MKNTRADENATKKKKNRGIAFIVFERERDMKGKADMSYARHDFPLVGFYHSVFTSFFG